MSDAYLLRRVDYRDADLLVTFYTQEHGKLVVVARGAKRSEKRFGGRLEPMHTLKLELSPGRGDRPSLKSVEIVHARTSLASSLEALSAAGQALGWLRHSAQELQPEPGTWHLITGLLDGLDAGQDAARAAARFGLQVLEESGWGLTLDACAACGAACPDGRPAYISPVRGGLVCRGCGGGERLVQAAERQALIQAARGEPFALSEHAETARALVSAVLKAHAGTPSF